MWFRMYQDKKVIVVMPAYNAAKTLLRTYNDVMSQDYVDRVVIVDDTSHDETAEIAASLEDAKVYVHETNRGYGANQKTCYRLALAEEADIVIMVHPDYQYTPKLIPAMVSMLGNGLFDCILGSRILGGYGWKGNMPRWRYAGNRFLTLVENLLLGTRLSEFHTGYRAYTREVLESLPLAQNSDDFVFDNQLLAQIVWHGFSIGEVSCPTRYAADSSSIGFWRAVRYGLDCLATAFEYRLAKIGLLRSARFSKRRLADGGSGSERPVNAP